MKKVLLLCAMALVFASFTSKENQQVILKDIDGTLLESYAVIDNVEKTVTFTVDANTTVSSSVIDGELKIFLVENGNSSETKEYSLAYKGNGNVIFTNYFENISDVASKEGNLSSAVAVGEKPRWIIM